MYHQNKTGQAPTLLFTEIAGYTLLQQRNEGEAAWVRNRHREVFERLRVQFEGENMLFSGNGTRSVFKNAHRAMKCAIALQQTLTDTVPLNIALHIPDTAIHPEKDLPEEVISLLLQLLETGGQGTILLSDVVQKELNATEELQTVSLGYFSFLGGALSREVFALKSSGVQPEESSTPLKTLSTTMAVLPFANMSPNPDHEYLCDGMTEEIINALTGIEGLKVTSRSSSFYFKGKKLPIPQIGRELGVAAILEGSIRVAGTQLRITAQLIDVQEDIHLWSKTFDRAMEDIFAVQDEVSLWIAERLREQYGHFVLQEHLVEPPEIPADAYQQYLKSRYFLLKMGVPDVEKGMELLREILNQYPEYPLAHLGMHMGYSLLGTIGYMPAVEAFMKGKTYLDKAIALNPELPECQLQLSWMSFLEAWNPEESYKHLQKVLEKRPIVDYYQSMASVLVAEGRFTAAMHYIETAGDMDPFSEVNYHLKGFIAYCQEKHNQAIQYYEKGVGLNGNYGISGLYWGQALIAMGKAETALQLFQTLPEEQSGGLLREGGSTLAYAALGDPRVDQGIETLRAALDTERAERANNMLVICYAIQGNTEALFRQIEVGIQQKLPLLVYLPTEPLLKPYGQHAHFQKLMAQILPNTPHTALPVRKYKKNLLSTSEISNYQKQLKELMTREHPYLDPALTLRTLAEKLVLPANHLSQLLNEGFQQNFAEFVNGYRLERFKSCIADPAYQHLTLLGLAFDCGFNSKTVFNTFFKKATGKTPKAYWKEIVQK